MAEWLKLLAYALRSLFKSRARLEAENLVLRQQINILVRRLPKRVRLTNSDRLRLVWLYRVFPDQLDEIENRQRQPVFLFCGQQFATHRFGPRFASP